jgi:hypothetical protein
MEPERGIEWTDEARRWFEHLGQRQKKEMTKAIEAMSQRGPEQRWPRVGTIRESRLHKMRELRSVGGHLRLLFTYDRNRPLMLHGGDKANQWNRWYPKHVRAAERSYAAHLRSQGRRPPWERAGNRSNGRTR